MMPKVSNVYSKQIKENTDAEGIAHFYYLWKLFWKCSIIIKEYNKFLKKMPGYVKRLGLETGSLTFVDYSIIVSEFLQQASI